MSLTDKGNMHNMRITQHTNIPQRNDVRAHKKSNAHTHQIIDPQMGSYDHSQDKIFMMKSQNNNYHQSNL